VQSEYRTSRVREVRAENEGEQGIEEEAEEEDEQ